MDTLAELIFRIRENAGGRPDLLSVRLAADDGDETLSVSDLVGKVHTLALVFEEAGVAKGERVAIWSENRPEWVVVDLAAQLLGLVTVGLDPAIDDERLAFALRNSGAAWIFYSDAAKRDRLLALAGALTVPPRAVAFEERDAMPGGTSITRLLGASAARRGEVPLERLRDRVAGDDPATIVYPLARQSTPRGVVLAHRDLAAAIDALGMRVVCGPRDRALSFLSCAGLAQRTVDYLCLARGVAVHHLPVLTRLSATLERVRPTLLHAAPWTFEQARARHETDLEQTAPWRRWLADRFALDRRRHLLGGALRLALVSGVPSPATAEFFETLGLPLSPGLIHPEAGTWLTLDAPDRHRPGSLGTALPGVELRVGDDGDGEILARGPGVITGYWQSPDATAAATAPDGWRRTGVRGRLDDDGHLFVERDSG